VGDKLPFLPLWVRDYLVDTAHLSDAEHGRYLLLLILMWRSPHCRVPDDDDWLARRLGRTVDEIRNLFRPLINEYCKCIRGFVVQKRLIAQYERSLSISVQRRRAANVRWDKEKEACKRMPAAYENPKANAKANIERKQESREARDVTAGNGNGEEADKDLLFRTGTLSLVSRGYAESTANGVLGRWLKAGYSAGMILAALRAADERPGLLNFVGYVGETLKKSGGGKFDADLFAQKMRDLDQRDREAAEAGQGQGGQEGNRRA
jgi:uncharacterized protein YdaU (DUF1376 family)